jgi:Tfp pilus assembly protein PilX
MKTRTAQKSKGGIAVFAILSMSVLLTVGLGVAGLTGQSMRRAQRDKDAVSLFQSAQAGLDYQVAKSFVALDASNGVFTSQEFNLSDDLETITGKATVTTKIQPTADPTKSWITATAALGGTSRSVRHFVGSRNVGIWNNAVFAGTGASGQAINGNVDIRGSVHILGDGEAYSDLNGNGKRDIAETFTDTNGNGVWDPGESFIDANGDGVCNPAEPYNDTNNNGVYDPPLTQTDLNSSFSGNAYVGNNYSGMPFSLESLVPNPPTIGGIETLGTEVRVKHGRIGISGSATIGTSGVVDGGTSKSTIDGSYVNDGYTGNQGASAVFSDNGTNNGYDIGAL